MGLNVILLFMTFSSLAILGLLSDEGRGLAFSRTREEWTADLIGLFIQGVLIPAVPFLIVPVLGILLPQFERSLDLDEVIQFVLSFVLVDYAYYWNHRLFHKKDYWPVHRLHHSSRHLDILATSRNSLITSFLFVYLWAQILGMFLLKDPTAFLFGLGLTFALDLWRHSGIRQPQIIHQALGWALILPEHHVLHHSLIGRNKNFGANLCWWDKIHGTYSSDHVQNRNLEKLSEKDLWNELISPWSKK